MAGKNNEITITQRLRPCFADGKKALFHKWSDYSEIVPPSMVRGGHGGGVLNFTLGIVELEDGSVCGIPMQKIKFADCPMMEFVFINTPDGEKGDAKNA